MPDLAVLPAQADQESGLSGELNLGHYGVTQANSFEAVNVNTQGAELITPFAKLQVPYKVIVCALSGELVKRGLTGKA